MLIWYNSICSPRREKGWNSYKRCIWLALFECWLSDKKKWLNANNAQLDLRTATNTGGWKLWSGSVVADSLFNVAPIVCWCSVFCPSFVMHYLVSLLVLQSSSTLIVFLMICECQCSVAHPHGAVSWYAVCECDISWPYSLTVGLKEYKLCEADC